MRVPFAADLATYGDRPAILTDTLALTYRELAERVDDMAFRLGAERRLVALAAANDHINEQHRMDWPYPEAGATMVSSSGAGLYLTRSATSVRIN